MKKFILKGKQLLSKKLQQFDIQAPHIDYVAQQTPSRLKQPLQILRQNEIDLEDSHDYETYFKNYPNHHLSHYLLDKFKTSVKQIKQKQGQANSKNNEVGMSYEPPKNTNQYIPIYDQNLQQKALAFKQSIQQYQQQHFKAQQPLICICVIHFHHKRGTQIEYKYPQNAKLQPIYSNIVHHAMPDSSHLRDQDCNFFNFETDCLGKKRMMFGISYFKQIKTTNQMKKNNSQITRSHVQKAIAVISNFPLFQYIKLKLQTICQPFFNNFTNFQIVKQAYNKINANLLQFWPHVQMSDLYMGCNVKKIINNLGVTNVYDIWKALLYQKRVVVFAQTSSDASSFILSMLSLFPGLNTFGICSKPISRYLQALRQYSLPLRIFSSDNILSISFHVQDFWQLAKFMKNDQGNFFLGTTNRLLKQSNQYGIQMLVNLQEGTVTKSSKARRSWQLLTKKEKNFISDLKQKLQNLQESQNSLTQHLIRIEFHNFLKLALENIMSGIKDYQIFIKQCVKYVRILKKVQKKQKSKNSSYQFMEDEQQTGPPLSDKQQLPQYAPTFPQSTNQIILPQLFLNKSFAYFRQFHNSNLPQIINNKLTPSIYINDYDYTLKLNEEEIINYNWLQKKLSFGRGIYQKFDGKEIIFRTNLNLEIKKSQQNIQLTKSIYIGFVQNGKYVKQGFFVDKNDHYEGQYQNGLKNGYGKFSNPYEKYIGNFKNNLYDGEGQLIRDGDVYAGSFRQGLKHGFGSIQGNSQSYVGQWKFDKPMKQWSKSLEDFQMEEKAKQSEVKKQKEKRKASANQSKKV